MLEVARKAYQILPQSSRRGFFVIFGFMILAALIQTAGIASIAPFIAVLARPELIDTNGAFRLLAETLGLESTESFLVFFGGLVLVVLVFGNAALAVTTWLTNRFVESAMRDLSCRTLASYLRRDYTFHLQRNSAELLKNSFSEVERAMLGGVLNLMICLARGVTVLFILLLLSFVDFYISLAVIAILGGAYWIVYLGVRKTLTIRGKAIAELEERRFRSANEALGGIKALKVFGCEQHYLDQYVDASRGFHAHRAFSRTISEIPRYLLEIVAFGGAAAIAIFFLINEGSASEALPLIAVYAFAGYRLLPALQQIYYALTTANFNFSAIDLVYGNLLEAASILDVRSDERGDLQPLRVKQEIRLDRIGYRYPGGPRPTVVELSVAIPANCAVGLVGPSGAGKTTTMDILLGLLEPQSGMVLVDGCILRRSDIPAWQKNIGYVPQTIYIADATLAQNIAFGVPPEKISQEKVVKAAKAAKLHEFVWSELPDRYSTVAGERGVRLSGGQRQRVGIARALYHDPGVLVFDEATSALDTPTEEIILEAVTALSCHKTIVMIAHRVSTLRGCDVIYRMEKGSIVEGGSWDDLMAKSAAFRRLAGAKDTNAEVGG